ncbi:MAG TPA: CGNR zinc finger domain-containing protein [Nocardioidaceae bacterium]|nr:CGNR zinc finger domain-containing protein [Nocardioidaceae bacterium]
MLFSHDTEHSLASVVDLVNTAPSAGNGELLPDIAALNEWVRIQDVSGLSRLTQADLDSVRALRERIRPVFGARDDAAASKIVNALISQAPVTPRLTDHDGYDFHIHYFSEGASLVDHLAIDGGMALAQVLAAGERERLRLCEAPNCQQALVDLSRNRSKRYCDARTCGNRLHVAAYRSRQKAAGA